MTQAETRTPKGHRRWGCLAVMLAAGAFALLAVLGAWPGARRAALEKAIARATGGRAAVTGPIRLRPELTIPGIALDAPAPCAQPALLRIHDIRVNYSLLPDAGRMVHAVDIARIEITPDASAIPSNFAFLLGNGETASGGGNAGAPALAIPKHFSVGEIAGGVRMPEWRLDFGGIAVEGGFDDSNHYGAKVSGATARCAWTAPDPAFSGEFANGGMALIFTREPGVYYLDATAALPGIANITGKGLLETTQAHRIASVEFSRVELEGPFWNGLAKTQLPVPLAFDRLAFSDTRLDARFDGDTPSMLDARVTLDIAQLRVGPEAAPWFADTVHAEIKGEQPDSLLNNFTATIAPEKCGPLTVNASYSPEGQIQARVALEGWTPNKIMAISPAAKVYLESYASAIEKLGISAKIAQDAGAWRINIQSDVELKEEPPVALEAEARFEPGTKTITLPRAELQRGEALRLTLEDGAAAPDASSVSATLTAAFDAGELGKMLGIEGPWGEMGARAHAAWKNGSVRLDTLTLHTESMGYGDWHLPYGTALEISGAVRLDAAAKSARADALEAALGEDTRLTVTKLDASAAEAHVAEATLATGFAPMVALGYLAAAKGKAEALATDIAWREGALGGTGTFGVEAESLAFANETGVASGVSITGGVFDIAAQSAACEARIADLEIAGKAHLRDVLAKVTFEKGRLSLNIEQAMLFNGALRGAIEVDLLALELPIHASGTLDKVDLAQFTQEVKPPAVLLTGIASGTFDAKLHRDGIAALDAKLESAENFSINHDVIQQLALYTQGVAILGKSLQRAIGETDPRPFDSAEMTVGFAGEVATIKIRVKSRLLDLAPVFDIHTDWAKLFKIIREEGFENIQGFSTTPEPAAADGKE